MVKLTKFVKKNKDILPDIKIKKKSNVEESVEEILQKLLKKQ